MQFLKKKCKYLRIWREERFKRKKVKHSNRKKEMKKKETKDYMKQRKKVQYIQMDEV